MLKLRDYCSVCNSEDDGIVGIQYHDGMPRILFPRGYTISDDDDIIRKDILGLITILKRFSKKREGQNRIDDDEKQTTFPIFSYQYVIKDFIAHGYYTEKNVEYRQNNRGKINWKRTIQQVQPQVDNCNVVYLDFITKRSVNKSNILTMIHEYCVYESFSKLGWLYLSSAYLPKKPSLRLNKKMFLTALNDALKNTFNNDKKLLFSSMIEIVNSVSESSNTMDFQYGVSKFQNVWQNLIDYVFGETNKEIYYPHARWYIISKNLVETSSDLEPDTIMKHDGKIFILDAKYYKFGITGISTHLPATSSIQKQITYGEYIATKQFAEKNDIYNAFVMPFAAREGDEPLKFVSVGTADWIKYSPEAENYKYVLGILLDTKHLMKTYARHNANEIFKMSQIILDSIKEYRDKNDEVKSLK